MHRICFRKTGSASLRSVPGRSVGRSASRPAGWLAMECVHTLLDATYQPGEDEYATRCILQQTSTGPRTLVLSLCSARVFIGRLAFIRAFYSLFPFPFSLYLSLFFFYFYLKFFFSFLFSFNRSYAYFLNLIILFLYLIFYFCFKRLTPER